MSQSLTTLRRRLGQELGQFGTFTATNGSATTLICPAAFLSSILPTSANAYAWVYVPSSAPPRQRRVTLAGLNGALAQLTVDGSFGTAVGNGTVFEVSSRLPCISESSDAAGASNWLGLNECVRLATRHVLVPDTLVLPLVSGQYDYPLSAWQWLDRPERLQEVRESNATGTRRAKTWRPWSFQDDTSPGAQLRFEAPYVFSGGPYTDDLIVMRPCDTLIKASGVWADSTVGLQNESDECGSDLNALVTVALAFAYRALRDSLRNPAQARYAALYQQQLAFARAVYHYDKTNEMDTSAPQQAGQQQAAGQPSDADAQALAAAGQGRP